MTIIEPKKNKLKFDSLQLILIGLILVEAAFSIFAYSRNVRLFHDLKDGGKTIEQLRVSSADLKNQLYAKLDLQNVDQLAEKLGLVREKNPSYLTANR